VRVYTGPYPHSLSLYIYIFTYTLLSHRYSKNHDLSGPKAVKKEVKDGKDVVTDEDNDTVQVM
jgi:hypothetical protein